MKRFELRIGDFVVDPKNNKVVEVGFDEIRCFYLFEPIPLTETFFESNGFSSQEIEGQTAHYLIDGENTITAVQNEYGYRVCVRTDRNSFAGDVWSISHLQHLIADVGINYVVKCE